LQVCRKHRRRVGVSQQSMSACLVMGSFSRKGKAVVVLQRIRRFNNMWGFIFSRWSEGPLVALCTRVLLQIVWLFLQESLVLTDFYLLHTEPYNRLISSRWRRCWKERAAQSWMQKLNVKRGWGLEVP
jgi:hypothetical protein